MTVARPHNGREALGLRVREIRTRLGKTLKDLGELTNLSKSTLSKIENGTLSVSYDNLVKLAHALSIAVPELFAEPTVEQPLQVNGRRSVVRKGGGEVYETPQYRYEILSSDLNPKKIFPMVTTLKAHSVALDKDLIRHPGEEFAFVLEGSVKVHSEFYSPLVLGPGDSVHFDSSMAHVFISSGDADATILWIATDSLKFAELPQAETTDLKGPTELRRPAELKRKPAKHRS